MNDRFSVRTLLSAARRGIARLNRALVETDADDALVFQATPPEKGRATEAERRIAEARKDRLRG